MIKVIFYGMHTGNRDELARVDMPSVPREGESVFIDGGMGLVVGRVSYDITGFADDRKATARVLLLG